MLTERGRENLAASPKVGRVEGSGWWHHTPVRFVVLVPNRSEKNVRRIHGSRARRAKAQHPQRPVEGEESNNGPDVGADGGALTRAVAGTTGPQGVGMTG